jgi:DnaJ-class molecular chaperone
MERMTAFAGYSCDTPVEVEVERVGVGAGRVKCFECGGTGVSSLPEELYPARTCNDCKGSGYVLVSV